ncbi:hypothetical protein E2C01_080773 [Portunus trituberculatus]|uniref:Uncharacterized protein n=1 Tax=Portunus trituberculatus TaxID=210409 RepID=A0A5B7IW93_PORTR|nr:hypothetical protein [Portunus trituberculatus]
MRRVLAISSSLTRHVVRSHEYPCVIGLSVERHFVAAREPYPGQPPGAQPSAYQRRGGGLVWCGRQSSDSWSGSLVTAARPPLVRLCPCRVTLPGSVGDVLLGEKGGEARKGEAVICASVLISVRQASPRLSGTKKNIKKTSFSSHAAAREAPTPGRKVIKQVGIDPGSSTP